MWSCWDILCGAGPDLKVCYDGVLLKQHTSWALTTVLMSVKSEFSDTGILPPPSGEIYSVGPEDGDRLQSPKRRVLIKLRRRVMSKMFVIFELVCCTCDFYSGAVVKYINELLSKQLSSHRSFKLCKLGDELCMVWGVDLGGGGRDRPRVVTRTHVEERSW
jgi:hypothetical protein